MTFEKYILPLGPYQEGNLATIGLEMDDSFDMTDVTCSFQVRDSRRNLLIGKDPADITIDDQTITIELLPEDTAGYPGIHEYELDFINADNQPFATIGGTITVEAQINTYTVPVIVP